MFSISKLKDSIGILFYRHGLFCASHPISCLFLVFCVCVLCCYPLKNLSSLSSSLEQYKQPIEWFDGLEANAQINEFVRYDRMADRPGWYNRVPIAYIQRIVVKSVIHIPQKKADAAAAASTAEDKLYLIDAFRTPLAHLFELNQFIRNFQTRHQTLAGDLCVHVGELSKKSEPPPSPFTVRKKKQQQQQPGSEFSKFNKHYLPEFNCLYLSPANFWLNNVELFAKDEDLMNTINALVSSDQQRQQMSSSTSQSAGSSEQQNMSNVFVSLLSRLTSGYSGGDRDTSSMRSTSIRDLLFGVSWSSVFKSLQDDPALIKKLNESSQIGDDEAKRSVVLTYGITIALRKYDKEFLFELKQRLEEKFRSEDATTTTETEAGPPHKTGEGIVSSNGEDQNFIYNLQYTRQSFVYYIPYVVLYFLLFLYIYISVRKIEFVKSKWGLAFAAVTQVMISLLMSIGICSFFGLTPTLNGGEIFPYLIIFIGFENIVVLTKSVVSTPFDLDVRYRIAYGLKKESWAITKILTFELIIIFVGICTMVPAIQEFCVFAYVGLLIDFFMQMIFFVTVLSIDIRRMELSDLNRKLSKSGEAKPTKTTLASNNNNNNNFDSHHIPDQNHHMSSNNSNVMNSQDSNNGSLVHRGSGAGNGNNTNNSSSSPIHHSNQTHLNNSRPKSAATTTTTTTRGSNNTTNHHHHHHHHHKNKYRTYGAFFANKSVQLFYFWARTRVVQRAIIALSLIWIVLIFYKSLLIVELMRHDVNVRKEHVEALLPRGIGLPRLFKDNFHQLVFTTSSSPSAASSTPAAMRPDTTAATAATAFAVSTTTAFDYLRLHFDNHFFVSKVKTNDHDEDKTAATVTDTHSSQEESATQKQQHSTEDDQSWKTLSYSHWLTLFSYYNVSLYNRYVAILPQINLWRVIGHADVLRHRSVAEVAKYSAVISVDETLGGRYLLNATPTMQGESGGRESSYDTVVDDGKQVISYRNALFELIGIVILGIPTIIVVVYLVIIFYKCLCSKNYENWRRTWSTVNIKKQYALIHSKKAKNGSAGGDDETGRKRRRRRIRYNKNDSSGLSSVDDSDEVNSSDLSSEYYSSNAEEDEEEEEENEVVVGGENETKTTTNETNSQQDRRNSHRDNFSRRQQQQQQQRSNSKYELINKIINGQKDNVDLEPLSTLNVDLSERHAYPVDVTACGSGVFASTDLSNRIHLWSLLATKQQQNGSSSLLRVIEPPPLESATAVWCMCISHDDRFLFAGLASGVFRCIDLAAPASSSNSSNYNYTAAASHSSGGITNLVQVRSNTSVPFHHGYLLLAARMDGHLELTGFNVKHDNSGSYSFVMYSRLRAHQSPLTGLVFSPNSDYLLTTSQDCLLKLIKVNKSAIGESCSNSSTINSSSNVLFVIYELSPSAVLLHNNDCSASCSITTMCLHEDNGRNELCGASGHRGGQACVWNFLSGECEFKLQQAADTRPIIKIEMTAELLVTLSADHQLCIWNRHRGRLVKELRFIAPLFKMPSSGLRSSGGGGVTGNICGVSLDGGEGDDDSTSNFNLITASFYLMSSLFRRVILTRRRSNVGSSEIRRQQAGEILAADDDTSMQITPTMCLYSKNILAMGGCACIFFWNIETCELVKKVNISKERHRQRHSDTADFYSETSYIKELRLVRQRPTADMAAGKTNKLLIASDYNDAVYVLKIPTNFF